MKLHTDTAFGFVPAPSGRTTGKPRARGITSMLDYGIGITGQRGLLRIAAHIIDVAKLATATARVYEERGLCAKIDIYREHDVRTLMGGQFTEYVFATGGLALAKRVFAEAKRVGFDLVEVSDTCRPLAATERNALIGAAGDAGLAVVCEVGQLVGNADEEALLRAVVSALALDVEKVIVEGAELVDARGPRASLMARFRDGVEIDRVVFELPGPGVGETTGEQREAMKRLLVRTFGPDVNLGNVLAEEVVETEVVRLGIEDPSSWT